MLGRLCQYWQPHCRRLLLLLLLLQMALPQAEHH
jgi:hypothetical protein